jgi:hypothetical protein
MVNSLKLKNVRAPVRQELVANLNAGREKFRELFKILDRTNPDTAGEAIVKFKTAMKDRVQNWLGTTYKIYEDKGLTGFKTYKPTDEAYERAVNVFRRLYRRQAGDKTALVEAEKGVFVPKGTDYLQKARDQVDSIIRQVQAKKKPGPLPDFKYVSNTAEGAFSLTAELIDLGADTNTAASVENYFDKINIFEDTAEANAAGKISETLVSLGIPGTLGFKLASNAVKAKKLGKYVNPKSKNILKAQRKVEELNKNLGKKKFAAGVLGGAGGEVFVADVEDIGTFGDMFDAPTALDREEMADPSEDAFRKLTNRLKFGSESLFITPFVAGVGKGAKALATRGRDLAYSNKKIDRILDKYFGAPFRPRGNLTQELFDAENVKEGLKASDKLRAKEIVDNITRKGS